VLTSLASLYVEMRRYDEAGRSLDRASAIFSRAADTSPMDWIKLLAIRGTMHVRQKTWQSAENDLRAALSRIDAQPAVDPKYAIPVLTDLAEALHHNRRPEEGRRIEARATALRRETGSNAVVDVSDLTPPRRPRPF
jgi:hypothetical protein